MILTVSSENFASCAVSIASVITNCDNSQQDFQYKLEKLNTVIEHLKNFSKKMIQKAEFAIKLYYRIQ